MAGRRKQTGKADYMNACHLIGYCFIHGLRSVIRGLLRSGRRIQTGHPPGAVALRTPQAQDLCAGVRAGSRKDFDRVADYRRWCEKYVCRQEEVVTVGQQLGASQRLRVDPQVHAQDWRNLQRSDCLDIDGSQIVVGLGDLFGAKGRRLDDFGHDLAGRLMPVVTWPNDRSRLGYSGYGHTPRASAIPDEFPQRKEPRTTSEGSFPDN